MPDEIEVPIEVDAATYAYLLKQATLRRPKGEGSRRKQLAKRAEDPTITQGRQQMKAAIQHFLAMLGFDPKEFSEESRGGEFAEWAKTADPENVKLLRDSIAAKILIGKDTIRKRWNL